MCCRVELHELQTNAGRNKQNLLLWIGPTIVGFRRDCLWEAFVRVVSSKGGEKILMR